MDERDYYYELENLLARFHQDLERVRATAEAVGDAEIAEYLFRAMTSIGGACCAAAAQVVVHSALVDSCT